MLKNFAEAQNNINTTFEKPLNIIGKISSIIGIILSFFFGYVGIYAFISSNQPNNKSKRVKQYKEYKYIFLILGILFIIFGLYLIFNFNNKKNLISMGWNSIFQF